MSPLVLRLYSDRGLECHYTPKRGRAVVFSVHFCRERCRRHGCGWERYMGGSL